ncbi:MAG: universal stress protein [Polyangiaceae bacterium]
MTIVSATDFSEPATHAGTVAAILAARAKDTLRLVFAVEPTSSFEGAAAAASEAAQLREKAEADRLRAIGAEVEERLVAGVPDEVIVEETKEPGSRLVVLGSLGRRAGSRWRLGSTADRTAQTSPVPVLVVRGSEPFTAWSAQRPLRVVFGADFTTTTAAVKAWLEWLCTLGPCDVVAGHVYFPPGERRRLGVTTPSSLDGAHPEIEQPLQRDLLARIGGIAGAHSFEVRPVAGLGNIADRLVELGRAERADLMVVGAHQRGFLGRLWHGSVSEGVLEQAGMSVACVPERTVAPLRRALPRVDSVLAATDFSREANAAAMYAYALLRGGGTVHLVHVAPSGSDKAALEARLRALVPAEAAAAGIDTQVHALEAHFSADALCHAADRLGAAVLVMGVKARAGVVRALGGSVAAAVMGRSGRPVLLVPPDAE